MVLAGLKVVLSLINARSNVIILVFSTYAEKQDYIMKEINDNESFKELYKFLDLIKINQKRMEESLNKEFYLSERAFSRGERMDEVIFD